MVRRELSSGGIIFRRVHGHTEIFFIKDPYGRWTFPKGHQELGENLAQTAVREIEEETGLTHLKLMTPLGRTSFRFRRDKILIDKSVQFFLFEAGPQSKEKMTGEGAIWEGAWFPIERAIDQSGYRNLDRLLVKALRTISQREQRYQPTHRANPAITRINTRQHHPRFVR